MKHVEMFTLLDSYAEAVRLSVFYATSRFSIHSGKSAAQADRWRDVAHRTQTELRRMLLGSTHPPHGGGK